MSKKYTLENISEDTVRYYTYLGQSDMVEGRHLQEIVTACTALISKPYPKIEVSYQEAGGYRAWTCIDGKIVDYYADSPDRAFDVMMEFLRDMGKFR